MLGSGVANETPSVKGEKVDIDSVVGSAEKASKISLYGGAVVFGAVVFGVYKKNTDNWIIGQNLMIWALALAAVCVIVGGAMRMYALKKRTELLIAGKSIDDINKAVPLLLEAVRDPTRDLLLLDTDPSSSQARTQRRALQRRVSAG